MAGISGGCMGQVQSIQRRTSSYYKMVDEQIPPMYGPEAVNIHKVVQHLSANLVKPDDRKPLRDS